MRRFRYSKFNCIIIDDLHMACNGLLYELGHINSISCNICDIKCDRNLLCKWISDKIPITNSQITRTVHHGVTFLERTTYFTKCTRFPYGMSLFISRLILSTDDSNK